MEDCDSYDNGSVYYQVQVHARQIHIVSAYDCVRVRC